MNEIFTNFSANYFHFERESLLSLALVGFAFILFEFFPGRRLSFSLKKLKKFIDTHLLKYLISTGERRSKLVIRTIIVAAIWVSLILSLANPKWDFTEIETFKPNVNVVFLIDISKSMSAEDEKPNRLERTKQEIKDILENIRAVNFGIVVFAEQAAVISPLTDDTEAIKYYLPYINTDLVGVQGSNISVGMNAAKNLLAGNENGINYVVLMSDGGFEDIGKIAGLKKEMEKINIISYAFGTDVGSPIKSDAGGYIKYNDKIVITKLESASLIALSGKDMVIKSSYLDDDVKKLKSFIDADIIAQENKYKSLRVWNDRFYIPLALAMIMLALFFRKGSVFPILVLFLLFSGEVKAQENKRQIEDVNLLKFENIFSKDFFRNKDQIAYDRFKKAKFNEAEQLFSDAYNKGVAAYKLKDYKKSEEYFSKSAKTADSLYNIGNAQLAQTKAAEAIKSYEEALKIEPQNEDAKFNLELAKKLLEQQKRNPGQQNQQSQNQNNNSGNGNNSKNGQDKNNQQQNADGKNNDEGEQNPTNENFSSSLSGISQNQLQDPGKTISNALRVEADKLFEKISGDPSKIIQNRIEAESKGRKSDAVKPW